MKTILLTGGKGMLGRTLFQVLQKDFRVIPTDLPEADITSAESLAAVLKQYQPDTVIHCAAMTAVDLCESEREKAFLLNESGCANVARACAAGKIRLIAISTDYVFDGSSTQPYSEYDRADGGRTVYGQSKFAGEKMVQKYCEDHLVCRISWLYGPGGPSFVHTMLSLAEKQLPELKIVHDQIGNPTSTFAVARCLRELILRPELRGIFHVTCEGSCSWYEFAREIFALKGISQKIVPCTTAEFPRPAPRPANSRLEKRRLRENGLPSMPCWQDALKEFLATL